MKSHPKGNVNQLFLPLLYSQVGPLRRMSTDGISPSIGWSSPQPQFAPNQRIPSRTGPADIHSFMNDPSNNQKFHFESGSSMKSESMELKPELFHMKRSVVSSTDDGLKIDLTPNLDTDRPGPIYRSTSAKNYPQHLSQIPELSASAKHIGVTEHLNGLKINPAHIPPSHRDLPSIKQMKVQ